MIGSGVAHADDVGGPPTEMKPRFVTRCTFSHRLADDPIVRPGQPGASHSHDFFGNRTTNANSTLEDDEEGHDDLQEPARPVRVLDPEPQGRTASTVNPTQVSVYYSSNGKPFDQDQDARRRA